MSRVRASTRTKIMPCRVCGNDVTVGMNTRNAPRCLTCGIQAAIKHNREMHEKSGPGYEKWRGAMALFAERVGRGRGDSASIGESIDAN